jgi:hypothetical protein
VRLLACAAHCSQRYASPVAVAAPRLLLLLMLTTARV